MRNLFVDQAAAAQFKEEYASRLKEFNRDAFNWEAVACDLEDAKAELERGDWVTVEISGMRTKSGHPELVEAGVLQEEGLIE